jgi:Tol biopolymer transport system component
LVYGKGFGGGLEVLSLRDRQTTSLVGQGKDAAWSPDGRWIAFVREASYNDYVTEEVWILPGAGGEPRRLVTGGFPSWSSDGKRLFVHSHRENQVVAVNPSVSSAVPVVFYTNTPAWYFSVSPDEKQVAFGCGGLLDVRDRATGKTVAAWPTPGERGLLPAWSPDGRLVAFGGFDDSRLGLWVFEVAADRAACVMKGACTMPAWSRDGRWLAFDDRADPRSVWIVGRPYIEAQPKVSAGTAGGKPAAR